VDLSRWLLAVASAWLLLALDGGRLDPAWFGAPVEFHSTDAFDFVWVKPGFTVKGKTLRVEPWPDPVFLGEPRRGRDAAMAFELTDSMPLRIRSTLRHTLDGVASVVPAGGDLVVSGRFVDYVAKGTMAPASPQATWDLKINDTATGELVVAVHHRVIPSISTVEQRLDSWLETFGNTLKNDVAPASLLNLVDAQEPGTRIHIVGVLEDGGRQVSGARLHVYQTDASGRYTPGKPMDEPHARLSGWLTTDSSGRFEIRTIRPGGYPQSVRLGDSDRHIPAHVHIDVTASGHPERRVQVVFADDPLLADPYWRDWVTRLGQPVVSVEKAGNELTARLTVSLSGEAPVKP
jgi:protocatechuate 3,4-dioxygenase beta subunit